MSGLEPWHMWGNEVGVEVRGQSATTTQLARVNYKRPESWSFFLGAELRSFEPSPADQNVGVGINLITGVGRAAFDTKVRLPAESFAFFNWNIPGGATLADIATPKRYVTRVLGPAADDDDPTTRQVIDRIVAKDINVEAIAGSASGIYSLRIFAFFAPFVHVRPDWFIEQGADVVKFRGNETQGT